MPEAVGQRLLEIPGVERGRSRVGHGPAFYAAGHEIAHFHGEERIDIRLTREVIRLRKAEGGFDARVRTRGPSADWVEIRVRGPADFPLVVSLVEEAARANAPGSRSNVASAARP